MNKPFAVTYEGVTGIVWATSAGKAKYKYALSIKDAGFIGKANPAIVSCRRAPEYDYIETAIPGKCYIPECVPKQ